MKNFFISSIIVGGSVGYFYYLYIELKKKRNMTPRESRQERELNKQQRLKIYKKMHKVFSGPSKTDNQWGFCAYFREISIYNFEEQFPELAQKEPNKHFEYEIIKADCNDLQTHTFFWWDPTNNKHRARVLAEVINSMTA